MNIRVFPQVYFVSFLLQLVQHFFVPWETVVAPAIRTGVSGRLPSRFESQYVARNLFLTEIVGKTHNGILRRISFDTVFESESPHRRKTSAAGEEVVSLDYIQHFRSGDDKYLNAFGAGYVDMDFISVASVLIQVFRGGSNVFSLFRLLLTTMLGFLIGTAQESGIPCRVDQNTVPFGRDVECLRSMCISESVQRIVVYYRALAQATLTESFELKSETVYLFVVLQRDFDQTATVGYLYLHFVGAEGRLCSRKLFHCFYGRFPAE